MAIKLSEEVQDEIIDFSQEQYPNQTTGFLFGIGGKLKIANEVKFVNNTASDQIDGYQINEKDYLDMLEKSIKKKATSHHQLILWFSQVVIQLFQKATIDFIEPYQKVMQRCQYK